MGRSVAGVVRERLAEIEQRIAFGWSLRRLHEELVAEGFSHELEGFKTALRRAREQAGQASESPAPSVQKGCETEASGVGPVSESNYFARRSVFR